MNAAELNKEVAISCGGFGAHDWYEKNYNRCKKIGAEIWCAHCHKDMAEGTGYMVNWNHKDDSLYPINGEVFEMKLIGNECIKNFLNKADYATYAIKVGA